MKIIYCSCNVSVMEPFINFIDEIGVDNYQVIEQVIAKSIKGDNRFNTPVWPGYNSAIIMQLEDDQKASYVMNCIRDFNKKAFNDNELVIACQWTMDDFCYQ